MDHNLHVLDRALRKEIAKEATENIMNLVRNEISDYAYKKNISEPDKFFYEEIEKQVRHIVYDVIQEYEDNERIENILNQNQ